MEIAQEIIFNGVKYRLMGKKRYYLSQATRNKDRKNPKGLHVAIWEYYSGKTVPKGYIIHHKDGNYLNNDFENLECISKKEHFAKHKQQKIDYGKSEIQLKHLEEIRDLTKIWHSSEKGREWHKEHVKNSLAKAWTFREKRTCETCGKEYIAKVHHSKYCCKQCQTKAYRLRKKAKENK